MKDILDKLEKIFNNGNIIKFIDATVGNTPQCLIVENFTWKELYELYEFARKYYDIINYPMKFVDELNNDPIVKITGDCGKVHNSFKEWQECKVCKTIMQRNVNKTLDGR